VGCSGATNPPERIPVIPTTTTPDTSAPASPVADTTKLVAPSQLIIDKIGVNTALKPMGLAKDGTLAVPDLDHVGDADWLCAQFYLDAGKPTCKVGAVPGAVGPAVIAGHIDGKGKEGVFFRLKDMTKGDTVQIRRTDASVLTFKVSKVEYMSKSPGEDPKAKVFDPKEVYGNVDHPALRLISCGGPFVGGATGYADNIVVFADLV